MLIQAFVPELSIETFHERILRWLTWLDKTQRSIAFLGPEEHRLAGELRSVIADDHWRQAASFTELIQEAGYLLPCDRSRDQLADHLA